MDIDDERLEGKENNNTDLRLSDKSGKVGMRNLGNTCYMNAALQCLYHTTELIDYFNKREYIRDINNQLDTTEQYKSFTFHFFEMLQQKWHPHKVDSEPIKPDDLKTILVQIRQEYKEGQQDSHELLIHVLDILHEQLKKIDTSGYIGSLELGRTYTQLCEENNKLKNDSIIMETFFGEHKSTIKCLECFEPKMSYEKFSSLGLPIPNEYKIMIYFIPIRKGGKPVKMFLMINDNLQYKKIIPMIQKKIEYSFASGIFYMVLNNNILNIVDMEDRCGDLMNRKGFLFLIENKIDNSNKMEIDNIGVKYISLNFRLLDSSGKPCSYPRVFSFNYYNGVINFTEIFDYLQEYIKQFVNRDEFTLEEGSIYFTIQSVNDECIICKRKEIGAFYCSCINKNLNGEGLKYININSTDDVIHVYLNTSGEYLKYKDLNKCMDLTHKQDMDNRISLTDLLDYYTSDEKLDTYKCAKCHSSRSKAMKKIEINKAPKVLIISLKRFRYDNVKSRSSRGNSMPTGEKNESIVYFETNNFDLSKYISEPFGDHIYELYAVCYHDGKLGSGHYYSVCKHETKWYEYNDKIVKEYTEELVNSKAYMLFYRKKI
jgi:ubiquitin C-terminal hydrolase